MENLYIYEKVRAVPDNAKKTIKGGRLNGMTDINPMWRIKTLTEQFGICGIGWRAPIKRTWLETGANEEITANVEIELYVKIDGEWSEGISGIGGSKFVAREKDGLYTDDECYKKAYTDAISVACKALGIGADVYWQSDRTKYTNGNGRAEEHRAESTIHLAADLLSEADDLGIDIGKVAEYLKKRISDITNDDLAECIDRKKRKLGL